VTSWFSVLGEPLGEGELRCVRDYLGGLAIGDLPVDRVLDWESAGRLIDKPDWDRRWWDAEQLERKRLYVKASEGFGEGELLQRLSLLLEGSIDAVHAAAAVHAERAGCTDSALIRVAAGAASQALYLAELAALAGESASHPFPSKQALFAGGHWPLGIESDRYYVF
jgi:hypothetical protein